MNHKHPAVKPESEKIGKKTAEILIGLQALVKEGLRGETHALCYTVFISGRIVNFALFQVKSEDEISFYKVLDRAAMRIALLLKRKSCTDAVILNGVTCEKNGLDFVRVKNQSLTQPALEHFICEWIPRFRVQLESVLISLQVPSPKKT